MKSFTVSANTLEHDWMAAAACRGRTDLFFPSCGAGGAAARAAKALCETCPVRPQCAAYARALPEPPEGVWAGMEPGDLKRLARERREQARGPEVIKHGTPTGYKQHRSRGEAACDECRWANNAQSRIDRAARKGA